MIDDRPKQTPDPRVPGDEPVEPDGAAVTSRAIALWPRLDRAQLKRAHGDPRKIARVITRRTVLPVESIVAILVRHSPLSADRSLGSEGEGSIMAVEDSRQT